MSSDEKELFSRSSSTPGPKVGGDAMMEWDF
jgi:hypothetical protein